MAERKRMVIVGNGPLSRDFSGAIDAADFVLRFNEPKQSIGMSGTRTDRLMMSNAGKPQQRRLTDPEFLDSPIFRAAKEVMLTYHPAIIARYFIKPNPLSRMKGRRADWTEASILRFGGAGKEIRIMPPQFYDAGCSDLGVPEERRAEIFPSTGYFGIWHTLRSFAAEEWRVELCGFTWEGWKRHAWGDERRWVAAQAESGRVVLIDPDAG
jgi:hypothetical protein